MVNLQQSENHVEHANSSGSCEEALRELRRSRSLSPECSGPIRCLRSSQSMPNMQGSRQVYNRMVGNTLDEDIRKIDQDVVAKSLKLMDDLLILVQADCGLNPNHLKPKI